MKRALPCSEAYCHTNPNPAGCDYYVARKRRFCRTACAPPSRFCQTHDVEFTEDPSTEAPANAALSTNGIDVGPTSLLRVPCPVNPNHTVYAHRLKKHVTVCPDLRFQSAKLPFYVENLHSNRGTCFVSGESVRWSHHDLDPAHLEALIARVLAAYQVAVQPFIVPLSADTVALECVQPAEAADAKEAPEEAGMPRHEESRKHGPQHRGLLRCIDFALRSYAALEGRSDLGPERRICGFVELGAGKGGLSFALHDALTVAGCSSTMAEIPEEPDGTKCEDGDAPGLVDSRADSAAVAACARFWRRALLVPLPTLLVVDIGSFRRKRDSCVRNTALPLVRLRLNIKDMDVHAAVSGVLEPQASALAGAAHLPSPTQWVAHGKHLCGACTDFSLSCITQAPPPTPAAGSMAVVAAVVATCCHHRCELRHLNPSPAITAPVEEGGATAVAHVRLPGSDLVLTEQEFGSLASMSSWAVSGAKAVSDAKRQVGVSCKRIIDMLRVHYLRQSGFRYAALHEYTTRGETEETITIVAYR